MGSFRVFTFFLLAVMFVYSMAAVLPTQKPTTKKAPTTTKKTTTKKPPTTTSPPTTKATTTTTKPANSGAANQSDYDAFYDLQSGAKKESDSVSVYVPFTGSGCSSFGVLKIALSKDDRSKKRVLVDLFMTNPTGWVFDLGDSETNNGYSGDAGSQSLDAEVQGLNGNLEGYNSDIGGSGLAFSVQYNYANRLTLIAGDSQIVFIKDGDPKTTNYFNSPGLYGLNGQTEYEGTVNYDLYLGVNGVVDGAYYNGRTGSGVCKVGIKILPQI